MNFILINKNIFVSRISNSYIYSYKYSYRLIHYIKL